MDFKGCQFPNLPKTFIIYWLILLFLILNKQDTQGTHEIKINFP